MFVKYGATTPTTPAPRQREKSEFFFLLFICFLCVCASFSCFQKATVGRRCYCWEGPGGPGRTAARLGWPAREEAAGGRGEKGGASTVCQ